MGGKGTSFHVIVFERMWKMVYDPPAIHFSSKAVLHHMALHAPFAYNIFCQSFAGFCQSLFNTWLIFMSQILSWLCLNPSHTTPFAHWWMEQGFDFFLLHEQWTSFKYGVSKTKRYFNITCNHGDLSLGVSLNKPKTWPRSPWLQERLEFKGINRKSTFFRDALFLKDTHEAERSQNPEHVFHENMGKLKAVKRRKSLARRYFESC